MQEVADRDDKDLEQEIAQQLARAGMPVTSISEVNITPDDEDVDIHEVTTMDERVENLLAQTSQEQEQQGR